MVTKVIFSSAGNSLGAELWVSDGTVGGTSLLKDVNPGLTGSYPGQITAFGNGALFVATDGTHGRDLWITNGTSAGTSLVTEIKVGTGDPGVSGMVSLGGRAVFAANAATSIGSELWVTDGTAGGTSLLMDIRPGSTGSNPTGFAVVGGRAFFNADDGTHGKELWVTDGTAAGTSLVRDINTGFGSNVPSTAADPTFITPFGSGVIFQANDQTHSREVWVSDGTAAGTSLVKDIRTPNFYAGEPKGFTVLGAKVLFDATDGNTSHGYQAWVTDGTAGGTSMLTSMNGVNGGDPRAFSALGGQALFWGTPNGTLGHKTLWVTDGTTAGTSQISGLTPAAGTYNQKMGLAGGKIVFGARPDATTPFTLWVTDGTTGGTSEIANVSLNSYIYFTPLGSQLVFADGAKRLWVTDGTGPGTSQLGTIKDNFPGAAGPIAAVTIACFAEGTRIATTRGDVAVEALQVGDRARTPAGGDRPIRWIGRRRVEPAWHPRPDEVMPIRVAAHAFGAGAPMRDLYLSPDHAVFADGVLVPVRYLVNGRTVAPVPRAAVTYFHVELDGGDGMAVHDVLLAEGLACESYLDTGNRTVFEGGAALALHPDFARAVWDARGCAPLRIEGAEVVALRSWLLARAEMLGHRRVDDPGLVLEADGRRVFARVTAEGLRVDLPPGIASLRLRSRAMVPAEVLDDGADTRRLGVALVGLELDGVPIGLDSPRLEAGWHAAEAGRRWSDGEATIAVLGARRVVLRVEAAPGYWEEADERRASPGVAVAG